MGGKNHGEIIFSPDDVYNRLVGIGYDRGKAEAMSRTWGRLRREADQLARKDVNDTLFSYKQTKTDAALSSVLIFNYWQRGEPLPDDDHKLARIARVANAERWLSIRLALAEHFTIDDGVWVHDRIEKELGKARLKSEKAREAGKLGGLKKAESGSKTGLQKRTPSERLANAKRTPSYTDTETDTETYKPPKGGAGGFKKPTLSELSSYFQEINLSEDPQRFLDYYQANGWKVGRNPMKDWRAAARQWKARRVADKPKPSRYRRVEDMSQEELEAIQS